MDDGGAGSPRADPGGRDRHRGQAGGDRGEQLCRHGVRQGERAQLPGQRGGQSGANRQKD